MAKRTPLMIPDWQRPIVAVPLTQAFPQFNEIKEYRSKVCLFNEDRTRLFDVVSNRYQVIPHGEAINTIYAALREYFGADADLPYHVRSLSGGARVVVKFRLPLAPIKVDRVDLVNIELTLRNSYDRGWTFLAVLGGFRTVCSNGMMIGESFGSLNIKHVISAEGQDAQILPQLHHMVTRAPQLRNLWQEWRETEMDFDFAYDLLNGKFPKKYLDPILQDDSFPMTKWELYNHLTRFSTHDTKSVARRMEFDERICRLFYNDDALEGDFTEEDEE